MKKILLITDDLKLGSRLKEILVGYELKLAGRAGEAVGLVKAQRLDLVILDHDLKETDALQLYRQLIQTAAGLRVIMLSSSHDIPTAVAATKMGIADFLPKPLAAEPFRAVVEKNLAAAAGHFPGAVIERWLQGRSRSLTKMFADLNEALLAPVNLVLAGERGIEKAAVAELIHNYRWGRARKFQKIDLAAFRRENLESHFWAAAQEALAESGEIQERCGTLYLENVEGLEENFQASIFEFFQSRRGETMTIIGIFEAKSAWACQVVNVPPLRERKEDLPALLSYYLEEFAVAYNKNVRGFSTEALNFLANYDYPGNYQELKCLLEAAVLTCSSDLLTLRDLPVEFGGFLAVALKEIFLTGRVSFEEAKRRFERALYGWLLSKTGGETAPLARFLDVPRTFLSGQYFTD